MRGASTAAIRLGRDCFGGRRRKYLWPVIVVLVAPFLPSLIDSVPLKYGLAAAPFLVLVPILARLRQRLLLHLVAYWLFMTALDFTSTVLTVELQQKSEGELQLWRASLISIVVLVGGAALIIGLSAFAAAYSRGYSSRLIPFVLLALGPGLAFPSSLVPWIRGDYNLGLLITSDLLVIAGAVLVVWGVARLKETDRLPWPAIGLLLVHYVAMNNIEFMLPIEWPAPVDWVWQSVGFVSIGALVGLGLILGLAFLAVRVLRRIKGPPPPPLGPAPPPTPELVLPPDEWLEPVPSAPQELPKLRADRMFGMPLKAEDPVKEEPCEP